ncbi:MAG: DUF6569 family protein [Thermoguttaceae bacterium]
MRTRNLFVFGARSLATAAAVFACLASLLVSPALAQRPSTDKHVRELGRYLSGVKVAEPIIYRQLAVYPILTDDVPHLQGRWLTLDEALARGVLVVSEKGAGSVPVLAVENRSRDEHVLIMTGEVIAGGMQTRTTRHDLALAPGQTIDLEVFCVEAHRWSGEKSFSLGSKTMLPQSIQGKVRGGADQGGVWSEVRRNNRQLQAENATGSLDVAMKAAPVRKRLDDVHRAVVPAIPRGTTGFIFLCDGRPVGAELFGSETLARQLLPKLLDSYAVDYVLLSKSATSRHEARDDKAAIGLFEQICRAGSQRASTAGSGAGIQTRAGGLLGDGVSLDSTLVHYGVQPAEARTSGPEARPTIIYPNSQQRNDLNQQ